VCLVGHLPYASSLSLKRGPGPLHFCITYHSPIMTHTSKTVSSCFAALRRLRRVRRSVSQAVLLALVTSLIMTRLDYGSAVLAGLPSHLLNRLHFVLNAGCSRASCESRSQVRPRHSFAPGPALVTGSGKNPVSTCILYVYSFIKKLT